MNSRRNFILVAVLLAFARQLHAQISVDMSISRRLYVVYEPILVHVAITNLSGHDLTLDDADSQKWFSFQVTTGDGRIIPPLDLNYHLQPLTIPMGKTVRRSLNLCSLYAVQEFGLYRVKASVYSRETQEYYSSASNEFEITDGRTIWEQTVGVPGSKSNRTISLLTFRMERDNMLYIRVEDKDAGLVYTTNQLGRVLLSYEPEIMLDRENGIHVLQLVGARTYVYSRIGLNGEWLGQTVYYVVITKPELRKSPDGRVVVVGGQADVPVQTTAPTQPKLSDRPPRPPDALIPPIPSIQPATDKMAPDPRRKSAVCAKFRIPLAAAIILAGFMAPQPAFAKHHHHHKSFVVTGVHQHGGGSVVTIARYWPTVRNFTTVVIDAGHGGVDNGGIFGQRIPEKPYTLDVAFRLRGILRKAGFRTVMTRSSDVFVPLPERVRIANAEHNAIFVSVHFNSSIVSSGHGFETYYYAPNAEPLAARIQQRIMRVNPGTENRGVKSRGYFVLRKTDIPSVLVEGGFLTNDAEARLIQQPAYRQRLAQMIAQAIIDQRNS